MPPSVFAAPSSNPSPESLSDLSRPSPESLSDPPSESIIYSIGSLNATNTQNAVDQHIDYVRAWHLDIDQTR